MACNFQECDRKVKSKGLCNSHYAQTMRGRPLTALRQTKSPMIRDEQGRKRCNRCHEWFEIKGFGKNKAQPDGLNGACANCHRVYGMLNKYGLTEDAYETLRISQGGGCAVCGTVLGLGHSAHVDHDHLCCPGSGRSCGKCVRGLLCGGCNLALGHMRDDPKRLRAAADYLERF